jgi:hypothetical protein
MTYAIPASEFRDAAAYQVRSANTMGIMSEAVRATK